MQKARRQAINCPPTACRHTVSGTISLSFLEYFSPFPHGTSSLSVTREYLALEGGPPSFPQGFTCPVVLGNIVKEGGHHFAYRTITFCGRAFQNSSTMAPLDNFPARLHSCLTMSHNPIRTTRAGLTYKRFGLFPVRSPLLRESRLLSFPRGT